MTDNAKGNNTKLDNANSVFSWTYLGVDLFHSAILPTLRNPDEMMRAFHAVSRVSGPIGLFGAVVYGGASGGFKGVLSESVSWGVGSIVAGGIIAVASPFALPMGAVATGVMLVGSVLFGAAVARKTYAALDAISDFMTSYSNSLVPEKVRRFYAAWRLSSTRSADGASLTTSYDDDGDGIVERRQLSRQLVAADGSRSLDVADFAADGSLLRKTLTTQSPDGLFGAFGLAHSTIDHRLQLREDAIDLDIAANRIFGTSSMRVSL